MQAKQLPEGWKYTTLLNAVGGDPGQVVGGPFGSCLKVEHYLDGGVPIIRLQNIGRRNFIKKDIKYVSQEKADELSYHSYQSGDLILAKLGDPIGKTCIIPEDEKKGIVVSDAVRIRNANENLSSKYLMYVLNSDSISRQLNKQVFGTTRPRVNLEEVRNLLIPIPPLPVQRRIVAILEQAEALKQHRFQADELTQQFLQSVFYQMFGDPVRNEKGWETVKFETISKINMGQSPLGDSYNKDGIGIPLLNGPEEFGPKYPIPKQYTTKPSKICDIGDILFCVRGATAGRMNWADNKYCIGRGLASIQSIANKSDIQFLYHFLELNYEKFQKTGRGSTFINISRSDLSNLKAPSPPLALQQQFARVVEQVEALRERQRASGQEIATLFDALMEMAFAGELIANYEDEVFVWEMK